MNRIHLVGTLVWSVELQRDRITREFTGKAMLAVWSGVRGLDFVPVALRGSEAVDAASYLGEGSQLDVVGHVDSVLVHDRDSDGEERTRRVLHVIADRVTYLTVCLPRGGDRS